MEALREVGFLQENLCLNPVIGAPATQSCGVRVPKLVARRPEICYDTREKARLTAGLRFRKEGL